MYGEFWNTRDFKIFILKLLERIDFVYILLANMIALKRAGFFLLVFFLFFFFFFSRECFGVSPQARLQTLVVAVEFVRFQGLGMWEVTGVRHLERLVVLVVMF